VLILKDKALVFVRVFYGDLQKGLIPRVRGGEKRKMSGRSWVHPLEIIFYRRYPPGEKNKVAFFDFFNGKMR
jgi:hypothetical protein